MKQWQGLVFFDLDGTLLDEHSRLSEKNRLLLKQLEMNNIKPIIASGRAPFEIQTLVPEVDTFISLNGQFVVIEGEQIHADAISREDVETVRNQVEALDDSMAYYGAQTNALNAVTESAIKLFEMDHASVPMVKPLFYKEHPIYMLYVFVEQEHNVDVYKQCFGSYLELVRDTPYSLAILKKGTSKATGIQMICDHYGFSDIKNTYAFGDGNNDIEMLQYVAHAIVMDNANDNVKAYAEFVTGSNADDGIEKGLKHYELI